MKELKIKEVLNKNFNGENELNVDRLVEILDEQLFIITKQRENLVISKDKQYMRLKHFKKAFETAIAKGDEFLIKVFTEVINFYLTPKKAFLTAIANEDEYDIEVYKEIINFYITSNKNLELELLFDDTLEDNSTEVDDEIFFSNYR